MNNANEAAAPKLTTTDKVLIEGWAKLARIMMLSAMDPDASPASVLRSCSEANEAIAAIEKQAISALEAHND